MKHRRTIVIVLLNVLFCTLLLYFFVNNSYLRPWAGSITKEVLAGLLLWNYLALSGCFYII